MSSTSIELRPEHFAEPERVLVTHGEMTASTFRYGSGVRRLRIRNSVGHIDLLPFQGQQIWDAVFHGRSLTMRSMFAEPRPTTEYLGTYGAFFLHCGVTAMGNPGAGDTHPLHGEIPNATFQTARLIVGEEEGRAFMAMTGTYQHTVAFTHNYVATPVVTLRAGESHVRVDLVVRNLKRKPMELMYLAHINFRPVDGAVLVDAASDDPGRVRVRTEVPPVSAQSEEHRRFLADVLADPAVHRTMVPGRKVDPELVMTLAFPADTAGWAESMQVHPDGAADFVRHRPDELPKGIRWMTRTADQDAIGIVLPATAEPDGYTAEKAKDNVRALAPDEEWRCTMEFGALLPEEAAAMRKRIEAVKAAATG